MNKFTAKNIVIARESRMMSQSKLSEKSGVPQGTISKIELGQMAPSESILDKLACALDYPISFFDEQFYYRNLPITFYRKKKIIPKSKANISKIVADTNILCLHLKKLLLSIDIPLCKIPFIKDASDQFDAEELAREIRIFFNVPSGPINNLFELVEKNGIVVVEYDFCSEKFDGLSFYHAEEGVPPLIIINKTMPGDRQRFTVAHELGHIIMHSLSEFPNEESEKQADEFASELLMPRLDIAGNFNKLSLERLMDLKKYWKVSMQALIYRAKSLNRISAYKAQILWKQISMYGYKKNEPIKIEKETPRIFAELVDSHKQELGYSENELSSLLNLKADEFRNKYSKSSHCHLRVL